jgi:hypothetical protein
VLLAQERWVTLAAGIDLHLPVLGADEQGERARRLVRRLAGGRSAVCLLRMLARTDLLTERIEAWLRKG